MFACVKQLGFLNSSHKINIYVDTFISHHYMHTHTHKYTHTLKISHNFDFKGVQWVCSSRYAKNDPKVVQGTSGTGYTKSKM